MAIIIVVIAIDVSPTSLRVNLILPASGVFDETRGDCGPGPAFVSALILKLYEVKGVRLDISTVVESLSTGISFIMVESAPIT